ncbi:MAG: cytochrome c (CII) [Candidatus Scalindua rubra]|uniref:Cytochrome c (CII) n=1 Tax=Candidatus Scalindua rubra TaxID=1872076 RepID=A0A1E3X953_9BACT|nr:MAG: cytochrome c (CII) [Candidatus Scalindua rubra]
MKQLFIILIIMYVMFTGLVSCKKPEEVSSPEPVEGKVEEIKSLTSEEETLDQAMKRASRDMRKLVRALKSRDWVEIEMWANEVKEGIGYSCVELYMKETPGISSEFIILGNRFYNTVRRLIITCRNRDAKVADVEFEKMIKSCDECHERYKGKKELTLALQNDL